MLSPIHATKKPRAEGHPKYHIDMHPVKPLNALASSPARNSWAITAPK
jgi:hypothetical protein